MDVREMGKPLAGPATPHWWALKTPSSYRKRTGEVLNLVTVGGRRGNGDCGMWWSQLCQERRRNPVFPGWGFYLTRVREPLSQYSVSKAWPQLLQHLSQLPIYNTRIWRLCGSFYVGCSVAGSGEKGL
jgi:hypothetical protein